MPKRNSWDDESVKEFSRMWNENYPAITIAEKFNINVSTISGYAARFNLPKREIVKYGKVKTVAQKNFAHCPELVKSLECNNTSADKKQKKVCDLEVTDCRWPIGDPQKADFHFCGSKSVLGKPYCQEHLSRSSGGKPKSGNLY